MEKPDKTRQNPIKNRQKPDKTFKKCKNKNCRNKAIDETGFCPFCHPDKKKISSENGKKGGRPRKTEPLKIEIKETKDIKSCKDVIQVISESFYYLENQKIGYKDVEAIAKGCETILKALEQDIILEKLKNSEVDLKAAM